MHAGVFVTDQSTGRYVDLNGHEAFPGIMIKVPVYVALLSAIDRGTVKPGSDRIRQDLITGGSGWLQWRPAGSKISVRETAELMIIISDNTATNMLIDLLGGKEALNREFQQWGLEHTRINNWLGDFEGTNTTSPYDLVYLLARVDRGELISPDSKKWMYQTMGRTRIRTLLPAQAGAGRQDCAQDRRHRLYGGRRWYSHRADRTEVFRLRAGAEAAQRSARESSHSRTVENDISMFLHS